MVVPPVFRPRSVPEELCARYRLEGLWNDDTLGRLIDGSVQTRPALPLRIWSEQRPFTSTVAAVHERGRRLATGLRARGIGPGDLVAFQLPNWVEAAATFFGVATLGAVLVPVVHSYGYKELDFILRQSGARALITADRFGRIDYAAILAELRPSLPHLEVVVMVATAQRALAAGAVAFDRVASADPLPGAVAVDPDAPAVIGYTSGTTADPKGVIHTHRNGASESWSPASRAARCARSVSSACRRATCGGGGSGSCHRAATGGPPGQSAGRSGKGLNEGARRIAYMK
jgi:acyl-CoA synthetase